VVTIRRRTCSAVDQGAELVPAPAPPVKSPSKASSVSSHKEKATKSTEKSEKSSKSEKGEKKKKSSSKSKEKDNADLLLALRWRRWRTMLMLNHRLRLRRRVVVRRQSSHRRRRVARFSDTPTPSSLATPLFRIWSRRRPRVSVVLLRLPPLRPSPRARPRRLARRRCHRFRLAISSSTRSNSTRCARDCASKRPNSSACETRRRPTSGASCSTSACRRSSPTLAHGSRRRRPRPTPPPPRCKRRKSASATRSDELEQLAESLADAQAGVERERASGEARARRRRGAGAGAGGRSSTRARSQANRSSKSSATRCSRRWSRCSSASPSKRST
jgi:hypothetical protein